MGSFPIVKFKPVIPLDSLEILRELGRESGVTALILDQGKIYYPTGPSDGQRKYIGMILDNEMFAIRESQKIFIVAAERFAERVK